MPKVPMFPEVLHDHNRPGGDRAVFHTEGPSLTRQEFAEECDINSLMARYDTHVIGGPGNLPPAEPLYADFSEMPQTLMEYMDFMKQAENSFMQLPAVVRREFDNSAMEFVAFASDPGNLEQMRSWGLAPPAKAPEKPAEEPKGSSGSPPAGEAKASPAPAPGPATHGST